MKTNVQNPIVDTSASEIDRIFEALKLNQKNAARTTAAERKQLLNKFHKAILNYRPEIKEALFKDYRKHPSEVDLTEVFPVTSELKHAKSRIKWWLKKKRVHTPLALLGSSSFVKYEPKGVVLIISPWNFPINLTFGPLVSAIAAGNNVMIKPSELTPHTSALMKKIVDEVFDQDHVALVEGGVETSTRLLEKPFNHIFFTGSPEIGKVVMSAAARNLCSVTLELGGKSPTIVDETANIDMAARRIAWGKYINNGQVCIAPDYVYVHESKEEKFLNAVRKYIDQFFSEDPSGESSYGRIVNEKHFGRVKGYVDDAITKGAKVESGGQVDADQNFIGPTVMTNVPADSSLMTNEIFGPVMPVHTFKNIDQVIHRINAGEKPLALYIYSNKGRNIKHILGNTSAGGGCINHCAVHFFNTSLPFGGVNNSGLGKAHGDEGFKAFSNARGVLKQHIPNALELLLPPYNNFKQTLIDLTIKWF